MCVLVCVVNMYLLKLLFIYLPALGQELLQQVDTEQELEEFCSMKSSVKGQRAVLRNAITRSSTPATAVITKMSVFSARRARKNIL